MNRIASQPISVIAQQIWDMKYCWHNAPQNQAEMTPDDSFWRVAKALAAVETPESQEYFARQFYDIMSEMQFLPAGRILAGAGTARRVTLFNCFVMGNLDDSMAGIFDGLKDAALTMQQGGGIGMDFSTLRPAGAVVHGVGADASGPLSFMDVWDSMCRTIMSAGARRGAMMATMACNHPDIEDFIAAKEQTARLRMFNLSVLVSDDFMQAVRQDKDWHLVFDGKAYKTVRAQDLWEKIMRANYDYAEPGVIFIDRVNARNNLNYCESIKATNPCGEQPLPPFGACLLGSINLTRFIEAPFEAGAKINKKRLKKVTKVAIRMLDNCIDVSEYPLSQQSYEARVKRRIGLGVTGLGDALAMCGLRYNSDEGRKVAGRWMKQISRIAYKASIKLAREKGAFALFNADAYLKQPFIAQLPKKYQAKIIKHGIRNALLTSIAPTGTISLLAGNVSSGIEPIFAYQYNRDILQADGSKHNEIVRDYAVELWRHIKGIEDGEDFDLPDSFVSAQDLEPEDHLLMQAALQPHIDSSISKTINCPQDISFDKVRAIYDQAYDLGLKGCTTYRPNAVTGAVLSITQAPITNQADAHKPLERDHILPGFTYKLKWAQSNHAIYITINDVVQNGARQPFEIFINSKNMEHYAWTVALTRMISAVFRRGGDVSFVVEELKAVFDPRGGQWLEGKYIPSLLAAIGGVIEQHMIDTGFLSGPVGVVDSHDLPQLTYKSAPNLMPQCPKCSKFSLIIQEGCARCTACDYSQCE